MDLPTKRAKTISNWLADLTPRIYNGYARRLLGSLTIFLFLLCFSSFPFLTVIWIGCTIKGQGGLWTGRDGFLEFVRTLAYLEDCLVCMMGMGRLDPVRDVQNSFA